MENILDKISLISYILSVVIFLSAIILGVVFRIPYVIGELTGRNAKKTIEAIRKSNENKLRNRKNKKASVHRSDVGEYSSAVMSSESTKVLENENVTMPLNQDMATGYFAEKEIRLEIVDEIICIDTNETI